MGVDKQPMVSVMMVTYNQEEFVDEAIRSVMSQRTDHRYELIIGDDCSTDGTVRRCQYWQREHPDTIRLLTRDVNLGIQRNYMDVYNRCRGKYIAVCEGDDYWCSRHKLQMQADYMEAHPECNVCFHRVVNYYTSDGTMSLSNGGQKTETTVVDLAKANYITNLSVMYRRSAVAGLPEWLADVNPPDYILHMLHASCGTIHYINKPLAVYRQHSKGVWGGNIKETRMLMSIDTRLKLIRHFCGWDAVTSGLVGAYNPIALGLILHYEARSEKVKADAVRMQMLEMNPTWDETELETRLMEHKRVLAEEGRLTVRKLLKKCRALVSRCIPLPRIK